MPLPPVAPGTVDELACDYARLVLDHDPAGATGLGLHDRDGELPPVTARDLEAYARDLGALIEKVRALPASGEDELDRRGLLTLLTRTRLTLEVERPQVRNPLAWAQAPSSAVLLVLLRTHLPAKSREAAVADRCRAIPAFLESARSLLDPAQVPALWAQVGQAAAAAGAGFFQAVVPGAVPSAHDHALGAARALVSFSEWLGAEVAPVARGETVVGEAYLARLLEECHLMSESPDGMRRRGEELLARYETLLSDAGGGDWKARLSEVKERHPSYEELVPLYRAELDRLQTFCFEHDLVSDPGAPCALTETPEFLRPVMGYAAYLPPGPFDDVRSGELWVTPPPDPSGLRDHSFASIPSVTAHEGYPGHHLQMTLVAQLASVVRRLWVSNLMIEGWGLYVEELMAEQGYYSDDARLAQLALSKMRAARIVIDMALYTGEMGFEEAVRFLVDQAAVSEAIATSEVTRYTMTPTQPFSYLIGAEEIRRIRSRLVDGGGLTLRQFHDRLLSYGHLPPALAAEGLS